VYQQDSHGNIVKGAHTTYGGEPAVKGQERDDIIPVSVGGANSNPANIRDVPMSTATPQDVQETATAKEVKSGQIAPHAAITQILGEKQAVASKPSIWDSIKGAAGDVVSGVGQGIHDIGSAAKATAGAAKSTVQKIEGKPSSPAFQIKVGEGLDPAQTHAANAAIDRAAMNNPSEQPGANPAMDFPGLAKGIARSVPQGTAALIETVEDIAQPGKDHTFQPNTPMAKFLLGDEPIQSDPADAVKINQFLNPSQKGGIVGMNADIASAAGAAAGNILQLLPVLSPGGAASNRIALSLADMATEETGVTITSDDILQISRGDPDNTVSPEVKQAWAETENKPVVARAANQEPQALATGTRETPLSSGLRKAATIDIFTGETVPGSSPVGTPENPTDVSAYHEDVPQGALPRFATSKDVQTPAVSTAEAPKPMEAPALAGRTPVATTETKPQATPKTVTGNFKVYDTGLNNFIPSENPKPAQLPFGVKGFVTSTSNSGVSVPPKFTVYEAQTGAMVGTGKTRNEAIANASQKVTQVGEAQTKLAIKTTLANQTLLAKQSTPNVKPAPKAAVPLEQNPEAGFINPSAVGDLAKEKVNDVKTFIKNTQAGVAASKNLEDRLDQLKKNQTADRLQAIQLLKSTDVSPKDAEAIYHYEEDKTIQLTPRQQEIYDTKIKPLAEASSKIAQKLKPLGMVDQESYTPRYISGKGGIMDKLQAAATGERELSGGAGKSGILNKSAANLKHRVMKVLVDENGNRTVVSFKKGRVVGYDQKVPKLMGTATRHEFSSGALELHGRVYRVAEATTKEIERETNLTYHKNVLANRVMSYLDLRAKARAVEFLDAYKGSEEFSQVAHETGKGLEPEGWKRTQLPQFRSYTFKPRVAAALDKLVGMDDPLAVLTAANSLLRSAMFIANLRHVFNVSTSAFIGEAGALAAHPSTALKLAKNAGRAINAVIHHNDDYVAMLREGAPLMSSNAGTDDLNKAILERIKTEADTNPQLAVLKKYAGKALHSFSTLTWAVNDIANMARIYDEMDAGKTMDEAIHEVAKELANYRLSVNAFGNPAITKFISNPNVTMFASYHYAMVASYGHMLKELTTGDTGTGGGGRGGSASSSEAWNNRSRAIGKLAAMGAVAIFTSAVLDKLAQYITKDKNATMSMFGQLTIPENIYNAIKGNETWPTALSSIMTPALFTNGLLELANNKDFFTGQPVITDSLFQNPIAFSKELGTFWAQQVSPIVNEQKLQSGKLTFPEYLSNFAGIKTPTSSAGVTRANNDIYTEKPIVDKQVKALCAAGHQAAGMLLIEQFNQTLLADLTDAATENGATDTGDKLKAEIIASARGDFLNPPTDTVMKNYQASQHKSSFQKLLKP
jgi:hypothetical protein